MNKLTLVREPGVLSMSGLARSTLRRHIQQGLFPQPIKIGERCAAWPAHEIDAIIAARIAGKSEADIKALVASLEAQRKAAT